MRFSDNPILFTLYSLIFLVFYAAMFGSFVFYPLWSLSYAKKHSTGNFFIRAIALILLGILSYFVYTFTVFTFVSQYNPPTEGSAFAVVAVMAITPFASGFPIFALILSSLKLTAMKKLLYIVGVYLAMITILFLEIVTIGYTFFHTVLFIIIPAYLIKKYNTS